MAKLLDIRQMSLWDIAHQQIGSPCMVFPVIKLSLRCYYCHEAVGLIDTACRKPMGLLSKSHHCAIMAMLFFVIAYLGAFSGHCPSSLQ